MLTQVVTEEVLDAGALQCLVSGGRAELPDGLPLERERVVPVLADLLLQDRHGFAIQRQSRLGVNAQEMVVLLQLAEHWWRVERKVFPKKEVIAERVGLSTRQVQRHIQRLEELKLVKRKDRYRGGLRTSNEYDLSGLVTKLRAIEPDFAKAKKLAQAAKKPGGLAAAELK